MPNPVSQDLGEFLATNGVGTVGASSGWAIYFGRMLDSPDTIISTHDQGGGDPHPTLTLDELDLQVRVRSDNQDYAGAYSKAIEVKQTILGMARTTLNSTVYVGAVMRGDINFINYDQAERPVFTMNFVVWREPTAAGNRSAF